MTQQEWEPLSQDELEQRLDQAVEAILEGELVAAKVPAQHASFVLKLVEAELVTEPRVLSTTKSTSSEEEQSDALPSETVDSNAVRYLTDLLQNSNSSFSKSRLAGRARLSLSHTVLLSLTLLSKRISYRCVSTSFRLEKGNIHRIFFSFCERVNKLEEQKIKWPTEREAVENLHHLSSLLRTVGGLEEQCFPKVLGVLGHTRIPIRLPFGKHDVISTVPEVKRMKKEAHPDSWLNLELVCDCNGRFIFCRISRGSDTDRASALRDKLRQNPEMMPIGTCLVARLGYPLTPHILTPHAASHGPRENLYNKTLVVHFNILDQAVADLKARFQRLVYLDMGNYERAKAVVLTACILHNVFLDMGPAIKGCVEKEEVMVQEKEGEVEEEGGKIRNVITDLLYNELDSGSEPT